MIPAGYMCKRVASRPEWLKVPEVVDIFSVSGCVSEDFCDWVHHWKHNGYWLFNSMDSVHEIARADGVDLSELQCFYYRVYPFQWDQDSGEWQAFHPDPHFETDVVVPANPLFRGFDVVTYSSQNAAECSPLSCNHYAAEVPTTEHCLLGSFELAKAVIEAGRFNEGEPGPYRILEVNTL